MTYAGDVTSRHAYELVRDRPDAVLVDCRTRPEWQFVGVPDVDGVVFAEWNRYPDGTRNDRFVDELAEAGVSPDDTVFFLCRSGARSRAAAQEATAAGYRNAYNVSDGFEGPLDPSGRRTVSGWKTDGLPWRQS